MKNQHDFFQGIMTVQVEGTLIEPFLQACIKRGCYITNMRRVDPSIVILTIRLKDWKTFRQLRKKYRCKLSIKSGKGVPFLLQQLVSRLSLLFAFIVAVVVIFILANTLWSIKVDGLSPELEADVESKLNTYGVSPGKLTIGMKDPIEIQQQLLEDIPDLLWIGVKKQGTSYHLYGVEKTRYDTDKNNRPSDLVATKKGMIIETFIKKGRPMVSVYDVVRKGQVLATGQLVEEEDTFVHSEGEVIAETWYRVAQTLPLKQVLMLTDGTVESEYHLKLGKFSIPVWGFWRGEDGDFREEIHGSDWNLFGFKIPIHIQTIDYYSIDRKAYESSKKEIEKLGLSSARSNLQQELDPDAEIKEEKVLHLSEENGKVKLILMYKVYENIAETKYISQGD
ncbi:similar to stage IV sporulation protein [Halobacillus karajensis]|uniref:Sporulation protein YqfD n=1 Tax=Halobacillus karajensis TaxID=195088 RepID=A0A024P5P8_9BACI|nr:sporulation protein YqfD [Halobacillus karajensis]CDQ18039.1 sporulation protein YqfD [Halobacillus karajensis]CDQ24389.1 sporulation protein YqfD [Halobacillus karajensis]CDQ29363.1 sporulation protein YqfD [Halobacillus karajensis]SEH60472.1 similar to stage IV sporulation protein [Halobacillus karajensis]